MSICYKSVPYLFDLIFGTNYNNNDNNKGKYNKLNNKNIVKENNTYEDINIYQVDKKNKIYSIVYFMKLITKKK
jgi:hypothetical protein